MIELVISIMIIGVAVTGLLSVMTFNTQHSADPMVLKQAQSIAESLLEEIELQAFTYCDPDDANADVATGPGVGAGQCATTPEAMGPEAGESRYSAVTPFDNVNDYSGFAMPTGIIGLDGLAVPGLSAYSATVTETQVGGTYGLPADAALQIDVRVQGPNNTDITLTGYRFRYAPNATP